MSTKSSALNAAPSSNENGYTAADLAREFGVTPFVCRGALRATSRAAKPGGRWVWGAKSDPALTPIRAAVGKFLKENTRAGTPDPTPPKTPAPVVAAKPAPVAPVTPSTKPATPKTVTACGAKPATKPAPKKLTK